MTNIDARSRSREDVTIFAEVRMDGESSAHRIRVRNLSPAGLMGEGNLRVSRGGRIEISMRGIPSIEGQVVWVEGERFGVGFVDDLQEHHIDQVHAQHS